MEDGREVQGKLRSYKAFKVLTSEIISRASFPESSYLDREKHLCNMLTIMALIVGRNNYKGTIFESEKLDRGRRDSMLKVIRDREEGDGGLHHAKNDKTKKISIDDLIEEWQELFMLLDMITTTSLTYLERLLFLAIHTDLAKQSKGGGASIYLARKIPCPMTIDWFNESLRLYPPVFNLNERKSKGKSNWRKLTVPAKMTLSLSVPCTSQYSTNMGGRCSTFSNQKDLQAGWPKLQRIMPPLLFFLLAWDLELCGLELWHFQEIKIALSMILQHYRFTLSPTLCPTHQSTFYFFHKVWWTPIRIQSSMKSQGIKGPSYRFLHGNTKEIVNMISKIRSSPKELLHHTFPIIQPHIYSWIKLYGMNFLQWYGPQPQLIITEPEMIKEILNNKDSAYPKAKAPNDVMQLLGMDLSHQKVKSG
ncbi:hypothetical protein NC651_025956 [Populus alba x Populus x berolinensis]|nr:hypothetical protein NC651_025956 [Populus alba x Populus x berolinensis]